jgi:uncharacterized caspase-like protein
VALVALDCCRNAPPGAPGSSGGLASVVLPTTSEVTAGGDGKKDASGGTLVLFATAPNAAAEDASTRLPGHSPFTAALLPCLARGRRLCDIAPAVTDAVQKDTRGKQTPWSSSCLGAQAGSLAL